METMYPAQKNILGKLRRGVAVFCLMLPLMAHAQAEQDDFRVVEPYQKACDSGSDAACGMLGFMYKVGEGVKQDDFKAATLFQKACDGGSAASCGMLGSMYRWGEGVKQDSFKAVALHQKACDGGSGMSCDELGVLYEKGEGTRKDIDQALLYFEKACDLEDRSGCVNFDRLKIPRYLQRQKIEIGVGATTSSD
ncbi:MAG: sel1 repeat family protein [Candidatus Accumulibacter sp.]|jgi:hypothetical protein|nr:sel1 repeat family protein [Accumulibacter sp.]